MADCDVVVAGAGPVGACAALGLAGIGLKVLVAEPRAPSRHPGESGFEARTVALNPASRRLLEPHVEWRSLRANPFHGIRVWEETGTRAVCFAAAEVGREELGWIAEVGRVGCALWDALEATPNVELGLGLRIEGILRGGTGLRLDVGGREVVTRLLIGADGAHSSVRSLLGVEAPRQETPHAALATVVRTERASSGVAFQRFLEDGPLALLPLPRHYCSVVWSQPRAEARRRAALPPAAFARELEDASERVLGAVLGVDERFVFDLDQQLAMTFNPDPRCLLIGDAARVLHPLAGQGVNVGLEDVAELLDTASQLGLGPGSDSGAVGIWRAYARRRRAKALLLLALMDGFRVGYALTDPFLRLLRNLGADLFDRSAGLKTLVIREALGIGLTSPRVEAS